MNEIFCFCTCAENKYPFYLARIDLWYQYVKKITDTDFFVIVDGKLPIQEKEKRPHLCFIQHNEKLGMFGSSYHAGWKRSLCTALKTAENYKYIVHIENDVIVFNPERVREKIITGKNVSGWVQDGDYMETAIMTLNDKTVNSQIINYYSNPNNLFNPQVTEKRIQSFADWHFDFKGSNVGIVGRNMSIATKIKYLSGLDVDYWGQFFYWGFRFVNGQFIWAGWCER